jgi:outer membrane receptor protein involved in Fe transport
MRKFSLILLVVFLITDLQAQPGRGQNRPTMNSGDGKLSGKVVDAASDAGMEFTSVALYRNRDSSLVTGGITGPDGSFTLSQLPYGKFHLVANFMGYDKKIIEDITITPRNKIASIGTIELKQSAKALDEVEVIAEQSHVEYKIDRKVINVGQDINASTGTAADVLQNTPSVTVDIDGNVSLRGSSNFTVLIDGKPTPMSGNDALQQIPASAIRNIEIITNPSAKFDPDGMAGIINIVSKKNALSGLSGIVNAKIGTRDKYSGDFLLNYRSDRFNAYAGATYRDETYQGNIYYLKEFGSEDSLNFDELNGNRDRIRQGQEVKAGVDYSFNDNNILGFSAELGSHEFTSMGMQKQRLYDRDLTYNNYILSDNVSSHGGDYYNLNLNYTKKFQKPGHELVSYVSLSGHDGSDSDSQIEYPTDSDYEIDNTEVPLKIRTGERGDEYEIRGQIDYTLPIGKEGKLEAGYQLRIDNELEEYLFEQFDPDLNEWTENDDFSSSTDFYRNIQALYATYGNSIGNYKYQLGLRGEYTDRKIISGQSNEERSINRLDFFPTLHFSRSFQNNHQLMASYSRRINRPRGWYLEPFLTYMNSTTLRQGDPGLEPEYMNSYEIGYQKSFGPSFIAFETYYKNTVNKIERIQKIHDAEERITLMTFDNISQDHSLGAELMLNFASLKWLNLNASTSVYRYWIEGEIDGVEIDTRSNNWHLRLNSTFNISSKTRFQLTTMYMGPSVTAQGEREAFFFTSAALRQDLFDRKLSATLQVRDIFGTMKHEFTSYGPNFKQYVEFSREPRVIMLSLSYKINNYRQRRGERGMDSGMEMGGGEGDMF